MSNDDQLQKAIELATRVLQSQERNYQQMRRMHIATWLLVTVGVLLVIVDCLYFFR